VPVYLISKSGVRLLTGNYLLTGEILLLISDRLKEIKELFK